MKRLILLFIVAYFSFVVEISKPFIEFELMVQSTSYLEFLGIDKPPPSPKKKKGT